jgi:hypothetical protein
MRTAQKEEAAAEIQQSAVTQVSIKRKQLKDALAKAMQIEKVRIENRGEQNENISQDKKVSEDSNKKVDLKDNLKEVPEKVLRDLVDGE